MKVLITGPESSGKSYLARHLAWCLDGIFVAEQARAYLNAREGRYTAEDLPLMWEAQRKAEDEAVASGASYVICDTGPEVIQVWSQVKYGAVDPSVLEATRSRHYDTVLLCMPDLPWEPDPLREAPNFEDRMMLFGHYRTLFPKAYVVNGQDRVRQSLSIVCAQL